ncbi:MAG: hypothetical protein JSV27_05090 [Candidatus Bathyarchaeota archaeon]|nr:MAG: hypothetical protein JSV27_05090 [Candidatus Bathyarchaeota archaeon]
MKIPSRDTDVLCDAAREADIIVALGCSDLSDRKGSDILNNTILFIGNDGEILGRHRKLMPNPRRVDHLGDGLRQRRQGLRHPHRLHRGHRLLRAAMIKTV